MKVELTAGQLQALNRLLQRHEKKLAQVTALYEKYDSRTVYAWRADRVKAADYWRKKQAHEQAVEALRPLFQGDAK